MKRILSLLFVVSVLFPFSAALTQTRSGPGVQEIEREISLYSSHRDQIKEMLRDTDTLILLPVIPGSGKTPEETGFRFTMSIDEVRGRIGEAVMNYCLDNDVRPDSREAIEFGNDLYQSLILLDQDSRRMLAERYDLADLKLKSLQSQLASLRGETTQRETFQQEPGIDYALSGSWRFASRDEIHFTKTAGNRWEGRYIHVENSILKRAGYTTGMLCFRNVKRDYQSGNFVGEYLVRYADGSPSQWQERELIVEGDTLRTRRTGQVAYRVK